MKDRKKIIKIPLAIRAEEALKEAVAEAIADHKRTGDPIVIWKDGTVVRVPADQIVVKEPEAEYPKK
jgi:ABC-type proline/glycine betaine transport system ATPase subunit